MSKEIRLNNVIISYPSLFEARSMTGENPKYDATFILDKTKHKKEIEIIKAEIERLCLDINISPSSLSGVKSCFRDADAYDKLSEKPEYVNSYVLKAKDKNRPIVINKDGVSAISRDDGLLQTGGATVLAYVTLWVFDNNWGKGISANLHGVQLLSEGKSFGGNTFSIEGKFKPVTESEVIDVFG